MAKFNEYPAKATPEDADKFMLYSVEDAANKLIDYSKLADAVLNKIASKQFTLDQGAKTLPAAINELNGRVETWMDNTTISGNWCSFIRFQGTTIGVNNYNGIIYMKPYGKDSWFKIEGILIS